MRSTQGAQTQQQQALNQTRPLQEQQSVDKLDNIIQRMLILDQ